MKETLLKEITPLTQGDCFTLFTRVKSGFDFPLHYHEEFELNFVLNAKGAKRIVGDHIETIGDIDLVLVGPNLQHGWFTHECTNTEIHEITIQFHKDLFDDKLLKRNQLNFIRKMFEQSIRGILFSKNTAQELAPRLKILNQKSGFDSVLELMSILHDLSVSRNMHSLSDNSFTHMPEQLSFNSRRIDKVMEYLNAHYDRTITLSEAAKLVTMADVAFSRFFKKRTGTNFIDSLNEIRLGHASRQLIDTTNSVAEIAYQCGFNNISNFNRIFKTKKGCTPKAFRENFTAYGTRIFV